MKEKVKQEIEKIKQQLEIHFPQLVKEVQKRLQIEDEDWTIFSQALTLFSMRCYSEYLDPFRKEEV